MASSMNFPTKIYLISNSPPSLKPPIFTIFHLSFNLPNHKIPNKNYPLTNSHYFYQKQLISHFKIQPLSHHKTPYISSKNHIKSTQLISSFTEPTFLTQIKKDTLIKECLSVLHNRRIFLYINYVTLS